MFDYKDKVICASFEVWLQAPHFLKIFSFQHLQLFCVSMFLHLYCNVHLVLLVLCVAVELYSVFNLLIYLG